MASKFAALFQALGWAVITKEAQPRLHRVLSAEFINLYSGMAERPDLDIWVHPEYTEQVPVAEQTLAALTEEDLEFLCNPGGPGPELDALYDRYPPGLESADNLICDIIDNWPHGSEPPLWAMEEAPLAEVIEWMDDARHSPVEIAAGTQPGELILRVCMPKEGE